MAKYTSKKICNTHMIMSYLAHLEMSAFTNAIMSSIKGGYYGRGRHYRNEVKGIKTATHSQEDSRKNSEAS